MSIAFLWVWEPFQPSSHCILCWIPRYSGNDPLWHSPCCYGSVDSDTLPNPNRMQHIFNEIALGGRSVVNLWSVVLNGLQIFCSPRANQEERFVWKSVQDTAMAVCACPQERQITSVISNGDFGDCWCFLYRVSDFKNVSNWAQVCQDAKICS